MPLLHLVVALVIVAMVGWIANMSVRVPGSVKSILNVVLALIVVGIALELINVYVPMAASIKAILNIVVVVATCIGVLKSVGLWDKIVRMWNDFTARHHISSTP